MSVAKVIALKKSRAIFTHCYGHPLNLGVGDTIKQCQLMSSALEVVASSADRGGNRGNLPGPECKVSPKQCQTYSNKIRSLVKFQSSFFKGLVSLYFRLSQPALLLCVLCC